MDVDSPLIAFLLGLEASLFPLLSKTTKPQNHKTTKPQNTIVGIIRLKFFSGFHFPVDHLVR
jgi:hypothetical protein